MNMFKEIGRLLTASGLMLVLAACGPGAVVYDDHQYTVDVTGLERDDSAAPTIIYRRPDAPRLNAYNRFIIDPVKITSDDPALEDMAEEDVQRMQTYLREAVIRELRNGGYEVGTTPQAGTMRISFTLSGLKASKSGGAVNAATMAAGIAIGLPIGIYSINVGEVTVEGVFRDALTNQIDAVAVAHSEGSKVFNKEFWSTWADVEETFDDWAEGFRKTVEEAHGR